MLYQSLRTLFLVAASSLAFLTPSSQAQNSNYYKTLSTAMPSDTPGKTEVLEFFAYTCSHCAAMEPMVHSWEKKLPSDVVLKQVPMANATLRPLQQIYYTFQALERPDLHGKLFTAIHQERKRLFDKSSLSAWAAEQGVDKAKFESIFDSFTVQNQVNRANQLAELYRVDSTPTFVVGGKYITSPSQANNSYQGALDVTSQLIPMAKTAAK